MLRSRKDSKDMNGNECWVRTGKLSTWQDLLSLTVWDGEHEYSLKSLFENILNNRTQIQILSGETSEHFANLKAYCNATDKSIELVVKTSDLMSQQIAALTKDLEDAQAAIKELRSQIKTISTYNN